MIHISSLIIFIILIVHLHFLHCSITNESETLDESYYRGFDNSNIQKLYMQLFKPSKLFKKNQIKPVPYGGDVLRGNGGGLSGGCSRGSFFSSMNPACQRIVSKYVHLLQQEKNTTNLLMIAEKLRDAPNTHPRAWYSALTMVTIDRFDLRGLWKPNPIYVMPDVFLHPDIFLMKTKADTGDEKQCIIVDENFGKNNLIENRLWYFREDIHLNAQHWYWHQTYPGYLNGVDPNIIYHADRRGELFYYVHHFFIARYNADRLSNNLQLVPSLKFQHGYVLDPYYANLNDMNSDKNWADRVKGTILPESIVMPVGNDLVGYVFLNRTMESRDRLIQGIDNGYLISANGQQVPLNNFGGIDKLVDALEPSNFSTNIGYYGGVHNNGHLLVAFSHDSNNKDAVQFLLTMIWSVRLKLFLNCNMQIPQVMADNTVSMRDVSFYNWHQYIDEICDRHKRTLPEYQLDRGDFPLVWNSIRVESLNVYSTKQVANKLETFWSVKNFTLSSRLSLKSNPNLKSPINVCAKHLNHEEFSYNIMISTIPQGFPLSAKGTVRVFMAPRNDAKGKRLAFSEQRMLFFILDTFTVTLTPGINAIKRSSTKSALTVPWGQTLANIETSAYLTKPNDKPWCGCGWPHHLLLPKGTTSGMLYDLFVIVTSGEDSYDSYTSTNTNDNCRSAYLLCGLPHQKYPDSKPMGYPFDRLPFKITEYSPILNTVERRVNTLEEYVQYVPNSATRQVIIQHMDKVVSSTKQNTKNQG